MTESAAYDPGSDPRSPDPFERPYGMHGRVPAVPAPKGPGVGQGGLVPTEQIAAAMHMQVELLRKINERQETLEEVVKDTQRSEMMLSSTRSLNESFRGMHRVQEKLLGELREGDGGRRGRVLLFTGLVLLAGVITWGTFNLVTTVEKTGKKIQGDRTDALLEKRLTAMHETLVEGLRGQGQESLRRELESRVAGLGEAIDVLKRERDGARSQGEDAKREREAIRAELVDWKERARAAETEARRLTKENITNQRMIGELSHAVDKLSQVTPKAPVTELEPTLVKPGPEQSLGEKIQKARAAVEPPTKGAALPPGRLAALNALLANHRGSERYHLRSVGSAGDKSLTDVVLEIRGPDGSIGREVTAQSLTFEIAARGDFLEMAFSKGSVAYHQGRGKVIKSPFFRNAYKVGVFGINRQDWLSAGLIFVQVQ